MTVHIWGYMAMMMRSSLLRKVTKPSWELQVEGSSSYMIVSLQPHKQWGCIRTLWNRTCSRRTCGTAEDAMTSGGVA